MRANRRRPRRLARWIADAASGNRVNIRLPASEERLALRPSRSENGCGVFDESAQGPARAALRDI